LLLLLLVLLLLLLLFLPSSGTNRLTRKKLDEKKWNKNKTEIKTRKPSRR